MRLVDEMLMDGEISKKCTFLGESVEVCGVEWRIGQHGEWQSVEEETIFQWKASGLYHELFSTGDVVVPEHIADPGALRLDVVAWREAVIKEIFEEDGKPIRVLSGRFGPYIKHGDTNANVPKGKDPAAITLEEAVALIAERAAKGGGKKPAKKAAAPKKAAAKADGEKPAKKTAAKKPAAKKAAPKAKAKATAASDDGAAPWDDEA